VFGDIYLALLSFPGSIPCSTRIGLSQLTHEHTSLRWLVGPALRLKSARRRPFVEKPVPADVILRSICAVHTTSQEYAEDFLSRTPLSRRDDLHHEQELEPQDTYSLEYETISRDGDVIELLKLIKQLSNNCHQAAAVRDCPPVLGARAAAKGQSKDMQQK
jgi:hypothetical protein